MSLYLSNMSKICITQATTTANNQQRQHYKRMQQQQVAKVQNAQCPHVLAQMGIRDFWF